MLPMLLTTPSDLAATLYYANGEVCSPRDLSALCRHALDWEKTEHTEIAEGLGIILYQAFRNTHEWARHSLDGVPLRPGTRSVHLESRGNGGLVELKVVDSGPGLASRILNQEDTSNLSWNEEIDACLECFKEGPSTSDLPHKGLGLSIVVRELKKLTASMQVHSGRIRMHQNFSAQNTGDISFVGAAPVKGTTLTFWVPTR